MRVAPGPIAALFAIMTKVGIYAIVRVSFTVFGGDGWMADWGEPALFTLGLATIVFGALGALATRRLIALVAYLVLISSGTLIAACTLGREALGGALYYLVHTTLTVAALFLVAHAIADQRGLRADRFGNGPQLLQPALLGIVFLVAAVAAAGLPPLSGFIGKVLMLQGSANAPLAAWFWASVLGSGLIATFALARAGGSVFWKTRGEVVGIAVARRRPDRAGGAGGRGSDLDGGRRKRRAVHRRDGAAIGAAGVVRRRRAAATASAAACGAESPMKRLLPHPLLSLVLWFGWLALNNSIAPAHILLGAMLAWALPLTGLHLTDGTWPRLRRIGSLSRSGSPCASWPTSWCRVPKSRGASSARSPPSVPDSCAFRSISRTSGRSRRWPASSR